MTNAERITTNNTSIQECIDKANALQDANEEVEITLQEKSVTPTETAQEVTADDGYDGLLKVNVDAIPSEYIVPSGTKEITENGTYDVADKASVVVNVLAGGTDGTTDVYVGDYEVTPKVEAQTLSTANKILTKDVIVNKIPYAEVTNTAKGKTVTIG